MRLLGPATYYQQETIDVSIDICTVLTWNAFTKEEDLIACLPVMLGMMARPSLRVSL